MPNWMIWLWLPWLLLACAEGTPDASDGVYRVALLTPGSIADGGWNAGAYAGLESIRDRLGAEIRHVETRTPADFEEGFRDFAGRGFDLIFGHGFEYQESRRWSSNSSSRSTCAA
ncbi:MAG: BMP family ABC transporter substrate-binding protein [Deltaproteobacteria bacterium]|nr:BMP family ABC transporter substrate-binding protein [Deltaproteobacteria bacterium]